MSETTSVIITFSKGKEAAYSFKTVQTFNSMAVRHCKYVKPCGSQKAPLRYLGLKKFSDRRIA